MDTEYDISIFIHNFKPFSLGVLYYVEMFEKHVFRQI